MPDDLEVARVAREAALATSGVYSLGGGRFAEAATYGAGEKVSGVVVSDDEVRVHIVAGYPLAEPIPDLAERIREKVAPGAGGRITTIVVDDLEVTQDEGL